ncbi:heat shock 70 kDa protein BIP1-like [Mangifera indica]|uniref:heat shock 70 kDa protein BIP1-like n=1 Tax=Mangifera indica TaxID=29780 RepID=UPI001CFB7D0C|nr:heat shock 70 kDa protein BIP1-like [Mangifera indica]
MCTIFRLVAGKYGRKMGNGFILNMDLFKKTMGPVKKALADAQLRKSDIDEILLVGGSTRIPKVQELLKDFFDGKEPNKGVNPDEAVDYGAAVYDEILSTERDERIYGLGLLLLAPLSLGIETAGGIYEGERSLTKDCCELGKFNFSGIAPAPRQVDSIRHLNIETKIELTLEVDNIDIKTVKAEDKATKKSESFTINAGMRCLSQEETERMVNEAEEFEEEHKKIREKIGARNGLESVMSEEKENKIDGHDKEKLGSSMKTTRMLRRMRRLKVFIILLLLDRFMRRVVVQVQVIHSEKKRKMNTIMNKGEKDDKKEERIQFFIMSA